MLPKIYLEKQDSKDFSFIHASDLHLGSHQYRNEERANDFINAFEEILTLAKLNEVDFILLGGDVFTSLEMLPGKLTRIISVILNFKKSTQNQIQIIAIEGNHDIRKYSLGVRFRNRGQSWLKLLASLGMLILLDADLNASPENRFTLYNFNTNSGGKVQIKNAIIYGTRYLGENPKEELLKIKEAIEKNDGLFHILLQHFGIEGQMENVPGINYKDVECLKERINYLALGHFHLQFTIKNWIYNPGSSEATCTSDFFFKRGIFLVKVSYDHGYKKEVKQLKLLNRRAVWINIYFKIPFQNKDHLKEYILKMLEASLKKQEPLLINHRNHHKPCLFLKINGIKPYKGCKINEKELNQVICEKFPFVNVKIYQKFTEPIKSIIKYL